MFSLTCPASMQIYWNKRKRLHKKRVQFPEDWFGTPTWPPFHCFGTPIWPPWRHVKTLYTAKVKWKIMRRFLPSTGIPHLPWQRYPWCVWVMLRVIQSLNYLTAELKKKDIDLKQLIHCKIVRYKLLKTWVLLKKLICLKIAFKTLCIYNCVGNISCNVWHNF